MANLNIAVKVTENKGVQIGRTIYAISEVKEIFEEGSLQGLVDIE